MGAYLTVNIKQRASNSIHGDFQFYEGQFNRQIGKALAQKFWNEHISYTFTTISNTDESLPLRIEYLGHFMKQHPNHTHILLSIHGNAAGVESASGFEFFSTPGITDSDYAANIYFPYMYDLDMKMRVTRTKRTSTTRNQISILFARPKH